MKNHQIGEFVKTSQAVKINNPPQIKFEVLSKMNQRNNGLNKKEKAIQEQESINKEQLEEEEV